MPRKPTLKTIKTVVVINGKPLSVSLYPPKTPAYVLVRLLARPFSSSNHWPEDRRGCP